MRIVVVVRTIVHRYSSMSSYIAAKHKKANALTINYDSLRYESVLQHKLVSQQCQYASMPAATVAMPS